MLAPMTTLGTMQVKLFGQKDVLYDILQLSKGCGVAGTRNFWVAFTATSDHGVNQAQAAARGHFWVCGPTASSVYINVNGSYYH